MEARLKAILEMESSQMQKELIAAANNLKKFERELAKATDTQHITYLQRSIGILNADITRLTATANGAAKATANVGGAMGKSSMNAMNFSRVIQDLPFGFMGIQNNLTQLIPGVGAAGLAFTALTTAITFSQVGLTYWTKKSKDAKAAADEFLTVTREANKQAAEEVVNSRLLYQAATNTANAMDMRLRAAKQLQEQWPQTFANYTAEQIALGKAKAAYDGLTTSIIANARATAAKNKMDEIQAEILNREFNVAKIKGTTDKEMEAAESKRMRRIDEIYRKEAVIQSRKEVIIKRRDKAIEEENKQIEKLKKQQDFYQNFAGSVNLQNVVTPPAKQGKATDGATGTPKDTELSQMISTSNDFQQKKGKWWRESQTERGADLSLADTTKVRLQDNTALNQILAEQATIQMNLNEQMENAVALSEIAGETFGNMAMAMMNGQNMGDVLAESLKRMVAQLVAAVAQAAALAVIMQAFNIGGAGSLSFGSLFNANLGGGGSLFGTLRGQDMNLQNTRTSTALGYRRGRR